MGVFRAVSRSEYAAASEEQVVAAKADQGAGDLTNLLHSLPTWDV